MEQVIWAEKYRPERLAEVINQKHVVERVKAFVKEKNIPHMLFAGPAGTGKTTVALAIAHELYGKDWRQNVLETNASVTPDTPIMIRRNGKVERISIGELSNKFFDENSKYAYPKDIEILSVDKDFEVKFLPIKNISRHIVNKIAKIKFEGGEIKTTLDHSVMILDEDCNLKAIKVSELKNNDILISFVGTVEGNERVLNINEFAPKEFIEIRYKRKTKKLRNPTVKNILDKVNISKNLAWLLGNFLAEGCIGFGKSSGAVVFTYGYPQENLIVSRASSVISNELGFHFSTHPIRSGTSRKKSGIQLVICSTQLARFFKEHFYMEDKPKVAEFKRIPNFVFNWPLELRYSFLQGYMGDATGEWDRYVRYSSKSNEALIDLAWLGRISKLNTSHFKHEARLIWKVPSYAYTIDELVPASPLIKLLEKLGKRVDFNWRYLLRHQLYSKRCKRIRKSLMEKILERIKKIKLSESESSLLRKFEKLVKSPLFFVKIKDIKIENYNDYVYDVSVPNSEMFWGGTVPILLHNSDERGIDTIRHKVKDFARTKALSDVGYRIIILDEADALTPEAQQALRRTMETYTSVSRFILICNWSSKIIEPIQSRSAVFRFKPLSEADIRKFIDRIVKGEKLKISEDAIKAVIYLSEGDLRKVANLLQASSALGKKITEEIIYDVASKAKPTDVKEMLELALKGKFEEARKKLQDMLLVQGLAGSDIIAEIHKQIYSLDIPEEAKIQLVEKCGEFEWRISQGGNEVIQIEALLAQFLLFSKAKS
jgi:replication factor C small subunit